jgi:mannose-1-phosphate guanylyltransferase/mannose-6-phosphate isomerase
MSEEINSNIFCLVMAGGQGTRFWPESTRKQPKQYLKLVGERSLLASTLERFDTLVAPNHRYIVTVKEQSELAKEHSRNMISEQGLIFEPAGRNTAPCILLAMAALEKEGMSEEDVVAIVPSDHVILNHQGFRDTIKKACELAIKNEKIVTIGIRPHFPHTGYGYIQKGDEVEDESFTVRQFKEKPDRKTAQDYVSSGEYFWNAGMFVSTLKVLKQEFEIHAKDVYAHFPRLSQSLENEDDLSAVYSEIPEDSIDYAIMEKSKNVMVVPAAFDWNDLGSWDALESVLEKENENTVVQAEGSLFQEAKGNIVFAPGKFVSLTKVNDLIIVSNERALVVLPKEDAQEIKKVVNYLKTENRELL